MSLENIRRHWRFLLTAAIILLAIAATGPLIIYGAGPLTMAVYEQFGRNGLIALALFVGAFPAVWLFSVIWAGDKADKRYVAKHGQEMNVDG